MIIKGVRALRGYFGPLLSKKTENCFSPICFDWFIRRITEVLNFWIYLDFTVAMLAKMANKIGFVLKNCHYNLQGFWRSIFKN